MRKLCSLEVLVYCFGAGFRPEELQNTISFKQTVLASTGENSKYGKYKGKPSSYGHCYFEIDSCYNEEEKIEKAVELISFLRNTENNTNLNIEKIDIHLFFSGIQGNMDISSKGIQKLAELNLPIIMNYIQTKDYEGKQKKLKRYIRKLRNYR